MPALDLSRFPLVTVSLGSRLDSASVALLRREFEALLATGEPHIVVYDASHVSNVPDAATRRALAEMTEALRARSTTLTLGTVIVLPNAVLRGALTAIHWIAPPPHPVHVVATAAEAKAAGAALLRSLHLE